MSAVSGLKYFLPKTTPEDEMRIANLCARHHGEPLPHPEVGLHARTSRTPPRSTTDASLFRPQSTLSIADAFERDPAIRTIEGLPAFESFAGHTMEEVITGLIVAGTVTMISGESGSGKTTLILAMASAIDRGLEFCGRPTLQRPALVLDRENPWVVNDERYKRLGIPPIGKHWGGWCDPEAPDPTSPIVAEWVERCEPRPLVVVDSLIAFLPCDENSSSEVRPYMHAFRRLADLGASIVLLHHSGKSETSRDYRGSSDLKAAVDVGFKLTNMGDPSRLSSLKLTAFKSRFAVDQETIFQYRDGQFSIDGHGNDAGTGADILQGILMGNPRATAREFESLGVAAGVTQGRCRAWLRNHVAEGTIEVIPGPRNARYHSWRGGSK